METRLDTEKDVKAQHIPFGDKALWNWIRLPGTRQKCQSWHKLFSNIVAVFRCYRPLNMTESEQLTWFKSTLSHIELRPGQFILVNVPNCTVL